MSLLRDIGRSLRRAAGLYDAVFLAPFRQAAFRRYRKEDDLFMLICFSEWLGLPNPAACYTLELTPFFLKEFHRWHRRMGMDRSPLDEIKCC